MTTHPMIERAARAACEADGYDPDSYLGLRIEPSWPDYVPSVLAVLRTLREPDEGMRKAATKWAREEDMPPIPYEWCFTAMIDSILPEEKEG